MFWLTFELQVEGTPLLPPPYIAISPRKCSIKSKKTRGIQREKCGDAFKANRRNLHIDILRCTFQIPDDPGEVTKVDK